MAVIKCKMCGGDLQIVEGSSVCECEYCGSKQTVPTADNEKKMTLFTRANRLLRNCEFDKASGAFETIVAEFPEEAEAYWGLCLCRYGIEYVDDPVTAKKIPTCHRTVSSSIMDDSDFDMACENADAIARRLYREEAKAIDRIQQGILSIVSKEEPYDVFICYKELDEDGARTEDSVLAQEIYESLTAKGLKVFFSRITLESKLGEEYEPYIYAALLSAKVMLAVGTSYENFDAVWVKNEWARFLSMMKTDPAKKLIPCFKGIDAYDMPREFKNFLAQDLGKLGWQQDLTRGVMKICGKGETIPGKPEVKDAGISVLNAQTDALLKRGYMMLEDGEYEKADEFFEKVLNNDAECSQAYWGKALAMARVSDAEKYGTAAFQKLKEKKESDPFYTDPIQITILARQADDNGLLKDIKDEELKELLVDLDCRPIKYWSALRYYKEQRQTYNDTTALHSLVQNHDFDRAAQYADEYFREAEQKALKSLLASIAVAIEVEEKKEAWARSAYENKKTKIIHTLKDRLSDVKQEQERMQKALEIARMEAEESAEAAFREATAKYEREYQLAVRAQENEYQRSLAEWQQKEEEYEQNYDAAVKNRIMLEDSIGKQQEELKNLTGLFSARKRKELESNISLLRKKLNQTVIPEDPGPKPSKPALLEKGTAPKREDFLDKTENTLVEDLHEKVKCGLSPSYNEYRNSLKRLKDAKSGDKINFGRYPITKDGITQLISWRVLTNEGGRLLLISTHGIDCKQYHKKCVSVTWEQCKLRSWLNEEFLNTAFNREEQSIILRANVSADKNPTYYSDPGKATQDQVFLLSISEVNRYFKSDEDRKCMPTEYAVSNGCFVASVNKTCWWWLRSPGITSCRAARVGTGGSVGDFVGFNVDYDDGAVRPALWINLDS